MPGRVTIKTIANDLGISHMTVSRALSNHPNVQKETREAVLRRAAELGYVKSAAAKAMRGDGTKIVGLLLPNIVNEFYARFANTMALACEERSYHLIIHLTNDDIQVELQSLQRLREVQAMAVVMVPAPGAPGGLSQQLETMKVIQLIRQRPLEVPAATVLVDDGDAISDAVLHLSEQGHRAIGYIGADAQLSSGRERLAAFLRGLNAAEQAKSDQLVRTDAPSFEMGRRYAGELLDTGNATAIVCGGFEISNGVLSTLMERGLNPGKDVGFIGYGDPSCYAWINGGISTIAVPVDQLAYQAVELLHIDWSGQSSVEARARSFAAGLVVRP